MKTYTNIYRAARMKAAQDEPTFSSRERAAAELYVSTEALQDYETGKTLPPCDVVQRMVEIYGCLLYTSPSPRDKRQSRMPSSA